MNPHSTKTSQKYPTQLLYIFIFIFLETRACPFSPFYGSRDKTLNNEKKLLMYMKNIFSFISLARKKN
jgi:hypothetical protein